MTVHLESAWYCQTCDDTGAGTALEVDKAAERHRKQTKHSTVTSHRPQEKP